MKKKVIAMLLSVCMAAAAGAVPVAAESEPSNEFVLNLDTHDDDDLEPEYGGTIRYGVMQLAPTAGRTALNSNATWNYEMRAAYESLLWYDLDHNLIPQLATEYEADPDEPSITWTLREGVQFSDGTPFNADAVVRNIQDYQEMGRGETACIVSCEAIDDTHVKMTLNEWLSTAVENIGCYVFYNSVEALDNPDTLSENTAGTGPFIATDFQAGTSIRFEKNENYWQEGKPYLDSIEMYEFKDLTTQSSAFQSGDMNFVFVQPQNVQYDLMKKIADKIDAGEVVVTEGVSTMGGIAPNSNEEGSPWKNPLVRRALAYAIDKEGIGIACFEDKQPVADQFCLPTSKYYDSDLVSPTYDPDKARELLAEAGYPDGFDTTINCLANSTYIFQAIAAMLEDIGVHCEINQVDSATITDYMTQGNWSGLIQYNVTYGDDLGLYLGNYLGKDGNLYAKGIYVEDEVQEALTNIRTARTDEEKIENAKKFAELEFDAENGLFSFVPFTYNVARHFKIRDIYGDDSCALLTYCWDHQDAWMKQE